MSVLMIAMGGFLGAICRYGVSQLFKRINTKSTQATLFVNLIGSFFMGIVVHTVANNPTGNAFLSVGFLGAFTTFSTFAYEGVQLLSSKKGIEGVLYILSTLVGGLLFFIVGWWIGSL